jgi:hypothetical protein
MTPASDHEVPLILVDASVEEITEALREELSPEDFAQLTVGMIPDPEEEILGSRRGVDGASILVAAVQVIGTSLVSSAIYDLIKAAGNALLRRYGRDRVLVRSAPEKPEEPEEPKKP